MLIRVLLLAFLIIFLFITKGSDKWKQPQWEDEGEEISVFNFRQGNNSEDLKISGWVPWWEEERSLESMRKNLDKLEIISPVWYQISEQGKLEEIESKNKTEIIELAISQEIKIIPTISNAGDFGFDPKRVSELLNNQKLQENFAAKIIKIAVDKRFDGWDLDWEEISPEERDSYSGFVEYLAKELDELGLLLSVSVHAQTGKETDWIGTRGQDLAKIGQYADFVRVMAYDFHHAGSAPGPVTPLEKLIEVVEHNLSVIPIKKLVIGLPTYGYEWGMNAGQPMQYYQIKGKINALRVGVELDEESFSKRVRYRLGGIDYTIWFEDGETLAKKIKVIRGYGIYQICLWHLGGEDEKIWESFKRI